MVHVWPSVSAVRLLLVYFAAISRPIYATHTLYIGGLFPMSGSSVASAGKTLLPISELAIDMVNNRTDVLNGYRLQLIWNDTQVFKCIFLSLNYVSNDCNCNCNSLVSVDNI